MAKSIVVRNPSAPRLTEAEARQLHEQISGMAIELVPTEGVKTNPRNAKRHPQQQVLLLAENMRKFGVNDPILIDENNFIIGGHARIEAARLLKLSVVPAIRFSNLTPQEKRAVALADNRLSELGTWDAELLSGELKELIADPDLTFDYCITGFNTVDIDQLLGGDTPLAGRDPADQVAAPAAADAAVTESGDLWICGDHRLFCGNALEPTSFRTALGGLPADVVFADPPHGFRVADYASKRGDVRELARASSDPTSEEFIDDLQTVSANIASNVVDGAAIYLCIEWRQLDALSAATRPYFGKPKNLVVWVKNDAGQGCFYRAQHELVVVYVAGNTTAANSFQMRQRGRIRTDVWSYPTCRTYGGFRNNARSVVPKPVALVVDALRDCSKRGQSVLDPFAGFGTTMIAAERTGRRARLIEIEPFNCDAIVRRWQTFFGKNAQLAESNESFAEVEARRISAGGRGDR